jgi:hypothetical protein
VSGPDPGITGTYLSKIVHKRADADALFAAEDGTPTL